jgi:serine/threonine-protein phosphatase CPPED1
MRRFVLIFAVVLFFSAAAAYSGHRALLPDSDLQQDEQSPQSKARLNNDPGTFQFAIVSDRTGGHRARVFSQAVEQLNLLQPEFVISVGDLIEGYTEDASKVAKEWREFQGYAHRLQMPFFYLPGNHDLANRYLDQVWKEKFGRRYYHFVYRNVLFLMVNSDDPPGNEEGAISAEQTEYMKKALEENAAVHWTVVIIHRPLWSTPGVAKTGWPAFEKLLAGRSYTVFAGHVHSYMRYVRNGMNYYQLATTGGASRMRGVNYGEFDEIAWVTMKDSGPVLANVLLDGIFREDMSQPITAETPAPPYPTKPVQPASGTILLQGKPVSGAYIVFTTAGAGEKKGGVSADAISEADGSYRLSTYGPFDGIPVGEYDVTIIQPKPFYDDAGRFGPNQLPARLGDVKTSGLKSVIRPGKNVNNFNIEP